MTALLIGIGVLVFIALVVAGINGTEDALAQRELNRRISKAAKTAAGKLDCSLRNDLGVAGISARMSGLTEFLRSLSSMTESGHRSGLPALALLTAALLAIGGVVTVVVDRLEDGQEFEACADAAAAVAAGPPTTTTTAPDEPDSAATDDVPAGGELPAEASAGDADAPASEAARNATDTPNENPDVPEGTVESETANVSSFLASCLDHAGGDAR